MSPYQKTWLVFLPFSLTAGPETRIAGCIWGMVQAKYLNKLPYVVERFPNVIRGIPLA